MALTREEWEWLRPRLCEGMTFLFTAPAKNSVGVIRGDMVVHFHNASFNQMWNIHRYGDFHLGALSCFKWPDGTDVIFFKEDSSHSSILRKIKSLDDRFSKKTLPKVKAIPLSFPR